MLDEDDFDVKVGTLFNRILFRGGGGSDSDSPNLP